MRISLVVDRMDIWGGVETHVRDLCHELLVNKHQVNIVTGAEGVASDYLKDKGVNIVECPEILPNLKRPDNYIKGSFKLTSILRGQAPHVVHSHNMGSEMPARVSSRLLNIPSVHTVHCAVVGNDAPLYKKLMWGACHSIASVFNRGHTIFVSDFNRNHSLKRGYVNPYMSSTIYNGVPDIISSDVGYTKDTNDHCVRMMMIARISPEKDHDTVLKALSKIKNMDWSIDFAGKGNSEPYIKLAEKLGIAEKVNFLGEVSDIAERLSNKDILVHASHQEALGIAIIEGMRAELPVVASKVGGIPELVMHGHNGYIFPDADADALSEQLKELVSNQKMRARMGSVGRSLYNHHFQLSAMASKTQDVYEKVVSKHDKEVHCPRPNFLKISF
jgi:glycosyltransferase involved in cell wall biosynthesis